MSTAENPDSVRWMISNDPAALARKAIGRLRASARTGDAESLLALSSLGLAATRPPNSRRQKGHGAAPFVIWLKKRVDGVRSGVEWVRTEQLKKKLMRLPEDPAQDFDLWFDTAWTDLYLPMVGGNPLDDEMIAGLARGAEMSDHSELYRIKDLVRRAARRKWCTASRH